MKRYVAEPGSELVRQAMTAADSWYICRVGFVEVVRAVSLVAPRTIGAVRREWPALDVIEVDAQLAEHAAQLAVERDLRTLDALHLAAAIILPRDELVMATWDRRLHAATAAEGLDVLPETLP